MTERYVGLLRESFRSKEALFCSSTGAISLVAHGLNAGLCILPRSSER